MEQRPGFIFAGLIPIRQALEEVRGLIENNDEPRVALEKLTYIVEAVTELAGKAEDEVSNLQTELQNIGSKLDDLEDTAHFHNQSTD